MHTLNNRITLLMGLALMLNFTDASAAIVMNFPGHDSRVSIQSAAGGNVSSENTGFIEFRPFIDYYANTVTTSGVASYQVYSSGCNCYVTNYSYDSSTASIEAIADVNNGILHAVGSLATSYTGPYVSGMGALAQESSSMFFTTDTPYAYTLDFFVSAGTYAHAVFDSVLDWTPSVAYGNVLGNGLNVHLSGTIQPGPHLLDLPSFQGCIAGCIGSPSGNFEYTLTLTAVPEPESWGLMMSGLALVGVAARRRRGK